MFQVSYQGKERQFEKEAEVTDFVQKITKASRITTITRSWTSNAEPGNKISFSVMSGILEIKCEESPEKAEPANDDVEETCLEQE